MLPYKITVKFFLSDGAQVQEEQIVPAFHSWIQTHSLPDHLAIDVADYEHVHDGPGTVLVTHEANFYFDHAGGRTGLVYQRKQPLGPGNGAQELLLVCFRAAATAAAMLEQLPALNGATFRTDCIQFRIADRLNAPNTLGTFEQVRPQLQNFLKQVLPGLELTHIASEHGMFEVKITSTGGGGIRGFLAHLAAPTPA